MSVSEWIESRLIELSLNTNELIERSRVSKATVYKLKSNRTNRMPNKQTLSRLESVLGKYEYELCVKYFIERLPSNEVCIECGNAKCIFITSNHIEKKFVSNLKGFDKLNYIPTNNKFDANSLEKKISQLDENTNKLMTKILNGEQKKEKLKDIVIEICSNCKKDKLSLLNLSYPELIKIVISDYGITQKKLSKIIDISSSMITRIKEYKITFIDIRAAKILHDLAIIKKGSKDANRISLSRQDENTLFFYQVLAKFGYTEIKNHDTNTAVDTQLLFAQSSSYDEIKRIIIENKYNIKPDLILKSDMPLHVGGGSTACFVLTYYDDNVPELFIELINRFKCRYVCFIFPVGFQSQIFTPKGYKCFEFKNYQPHHFNDRLSECDLAYKHIPSNPMFRHLFNLDNI